MNHLARVYCLMHEDTLPESATSGAGVALPSLSDDLRAQTAAQHRRIESLLGLPGAIRTRDHYILWLDRFLGLYEPLERALVEFPEWETLGLALPSRSHSSCLVADLTALGSDPSKVPHASPAQLPHLPSFSHALGAFYVLEGATLGGRLILRDLDVRIGAPIALATCFFGGRGAAVGPMWQSFRSALDAFGRERPQRRADVVAGAKRTFCAMLAWFAPFGAVAAGWP
jgi:heme oxygenase